jgi:hypothetical protein
VAIAGSSTEQSPNNSEDQGSSRQDEPAKKSEKDKPKEKPKDCGTNASATCTPRVGSDEQVRVDALIWRVTGAETTKSIGDPSIGFDEKADGTFLVVKLDVRSEKNESATLTNNAIQLDAGGTTYDPDNDGTVAAIGQGEEPLFLEDIGPDSTLQSEVVFDVPDSVLNKKLSVRFNELGFGPGHGYIKLPEPTSR